MSVKLRCPICGVSSRTKLFGRELLRQKMHYPTKYRMYCPSCENTFENLKYGYDDIECLWAGAIYDLRNREHVFCARCKHKITQENLRIVSKWTVWRNIINSVREEQYIKAKNQCCYCGYVNDIIDDKPKTLDDYDLDNIIINSDEFDNPVFARSYRV